MVTCQAARSAKQTPDGLRISVAVLAFNAVDRIALCLDAIQRQTRPADEIVVVDNGSSDQTAAIVGSRYPNVSLVSTGSNTGCSGGRNRQLNAARYGLVMVVDDDAFLHPSCLEELAKAVCELPDAAIWSPRVCYEQDRGLIQSDGVNLHYLGEAVLVNPDWRLNGGHHAVPPRIRSMRGGTTSRF